MIRPLLAIALTLPLAGCISLVPSARKLPPRYTLEAIEAPRRDNRIPVTLAIADARAEGAFNTSRIAVRTGPNEIRYLPEGEWSDRSTRVFSLLLERSFEEQGGLLAVSDRVALPLADYVLFSDIQYFEANRTMEPAMARVAFRVRLEDNRGKTLSAQRFSGEVPLDGDETTDVASALNMAAATAAKDMVDWSLDLIAETEAGN